MVTLQIQPKLQDSQPSWTQLTADILGLEVGQKQPHTEIFSHISLVPTQQLFQTHDSQIVDLLDLVAARIAAVFSLTNPRAAAVVARSALMATAGMVIAGTAMAT